MTIPGYGMPYGPYFGGRSAHNTTTSPSINGMFDLTNTTQAYFQQAAMFNNYAQPSYDPNLAFLYNIIQPGVNAASQMVYGGGAMPPGAAAPASGHTPTAEVHADTSGSGFSPGKAIKGAAVGAAIGSAVLGFPLGTGIGAGVGILSSIF